MNPAARERLEAMSPDEQRAELARLMEIIWPPAEARRGLTQELGIAARTGDNWLAGTTRVPLAVLLLLTVWAEQATELESERNWREVALGLQRTTEALARIVGRA